jgi:hypothetical protein
MNYGDILSRAWRIIWKHKVLWIFGIFAGCGQSSGSGGGNTGFSFSGGDEYVPHPMRRFFFGLERFFENIQDWQITLMMGIFVLIILVLIILALVLGTVGRIGIIQGTVQAEAEAERLSFGKLLQDGYPFFWRVLGLNVLLGIVFFFLVLFLLVPFIVITAVTFGVALLCLLPFICILIPLGWLVTVVIEQANIAIVVEDLNIIEGLQRGWEVFKENLGVMVVMGLILLIGGWIVGLIIGLPIAFLIAPAAIGIIAGSENAVGGGLLISALCFVGYLPVLIVLSGILRTYIGSAWTLTFLNLTSAPPEPAAVMEPQPEAS